MPPGGADALGNDDAGVKHGTSLALADKARKGDLVVHSFKGLDVHQVLRAPRRALIGSQTLQADKGHPQSPHNDVKALCPAWLEVHACRRRQEIDPVRWVTELDHGVIRDEIVSHKTKIPEPKIVERRNDAESVA